MKSFENKYLNFNNDLGYNFDKDLFSILENNSKFGPEFNTFPSNEWSKIQANFVKSEGKLFKAVKNLYKNENEFSLENNIDKNYTKKVQKISSEIKEKGFCVLENFLSEEFVEGIREELQEIKYFSNLNIFKTMELRKIKKNGHRDSTFQSNLTSKKIKNNSNLQKIFSNTFFKDVAGSYFENNPYLTASVAFYTKPKEKKNYTQEEIFKSAQNYHYDYSHLNFLKIFIYLTDIITPEHGSHSFIEKTHAENFKYPKEQKNFVESSLRKYYNGCYGGVIKDEWIEQNFKSSDIKNFCFKKGSIIFEDTSGLHRGHNCTIGNREMISLIYSLSNISGSWTRDRQPELDMEKIQEKNYFLNPILKKTKKKQIQEYKKFNVSKFSLKDYLRKFKIKIRNLSL
jgi:hypothetical protein